MLNPTPETVAREEREGHARTFYRATYARMVRRDNQHLPIWLGPGDTRTIWLDPSSENSEDAFVSAVAAQTGGSVYVPARLRARVPAGRNTYGGVGDLSGDTELLFVDWDTDAGGKPTGDDGGLAYAPDHDVLRCLIAAYSQEAGIPVHALTRTPNGFQTWTLTTPLDTEAAAEITAAFEAHLAGWLAERGYQIDKGVTTTPTRIGRAPGAYHSKRKRDTDEETPLRLVTVEETTDAPAIAEVQLRERLPVVLPLASKSLPVVDDGLLSARDRFARRFPVTSVLPALGWAPNPARTGSWTSPVEDATSVDAAHVLTSKSGAEIVHVWSASTRAEYGQVFGSADAIARAVGGDYRLANRLWQRALSDSTSATFDGFVEMIRGRASRDEWDRAAASADAEWPVGLSRQGQERLAFRGVSASVASGRGYSSHSEHPVVTLADNESASWILLQPAQTLTGQIVHTAQARVTATPVPQNGPGRPRKDANKPTVAVRGYAEANTKGLFVHLGALSRVQTDLPLVVVTQDDPQSGEPLVGVGQVQADAVLTAAERENLDVAVVHGQSWKSLLVAPGASGNPTHTPQPHPSWGRVRLDGRKVYLASRCTWRHDVALTQLIDLLQAKGADVHVLDVPRPDPLRPAVATADHSTRSVGDWLAAEVGKDPLRRLLRDALSADDAKRQARVPDATATAEMADLVVTELQHSKLAFYDATSRVWCRDMGTHVQIGGAGTSPDYLVRQLLWKHGVLVQSAKVLRDVVSACERDQRIQVSTADFDLATRELVVLNGIVDLATGELRPRPTGHLNSRVVPVAYDPDEPAPHWNAFIEQVTLGRREHADYLRLAFGLSLIGEVIEEVMFFHDGKGRNGKSTCLNVVAHVLGPFTRTIPVEWLESKPSVFQKGDMRGVRFAIAPEPRQGMVMNDAALKSIVSRDLMEGERKFGSSFTFAPSHTIHAPVNHVPLIRDRSEGGRRRFQVVPWELNVSDADADRGLEARLKGEAAGVLAWLVRGAREVLARARASEEGVKLPEGLLNVPSAVADRTKRHWDENDLLGQWVEEFADISNPNARATKKQIHDAFNDFLEDEGERRWSPATIETQLKSKGVAVKRTSEGRFYQGIALKAHSTAAPAVAPAPPAAPSGPSAPALLELASAAPAPAPAPALAIAGLAPGEVEL